LILKPDWRKPFGRLRHKYEVKIEREQVKDYEMGTACSTKGDEEEFIQDRGKARRKETTRKTNTWVGG
jgi:hypothetical protein